MDIVIFIAYGSFASPLIPLLLSFRLTRALPEIRLIQLLLWIGFVFDLTSLLLGRSKVNTYPIGNMFFLVQTIILLLIYSEKFSESRIYLKIGGAIFTMFFLVNYFFIQGYNVLNFYSISLSALMFILLSLSYFAHLIRNLPEVYLHRMPMIWINIAVLVYYSGNLFLFIFNNYLSIGIGGNQRTMWILHNILNISKNAIFLVAIWQNLRKIK